MKVFVSAVCTLTLLAGCVTNTQESPETVFSGGTSYNLSNTTSVPAPREPVAVQSIQKAKPTKQASMPTKQPKMVKEVEIVRPEPAAAPLTSATGDSFTVIIPKGERRAEQLIGNCASGLGISGYKTQFKLAGGRQTLTVPRPSNVNPSQFSRFENCVANLFESAQQSADLRNTPASQPL